MSLIDDVGSFGPETSAKVVTARDEMRHGRTMHDAFDDAVVTEREQFLAFGIARVPTTQRGRLLVRIEDVVLGVIEDGLGAFVLFASRARACIGDETSRRRQLPQTHHRVFAAREQVFGVFGEGERADLLVGVRVGERVDATIAHAVP